MSFQLFEAPSSLLKQYFLFISSEALWENSRHVIPLLIKIAKIIEIAAAAAVEDGIVAAAAVGDGIAALQHHRSS